MSKRAFVVATRSNMNHNYGAVFYRVNATNYDGRISGVLDDSEYPWAWGFSDLANAFKVADLFNADEDPGMSVSDLARDLAQKEREASDAASIFPLAKSRR